MNKLINILQRQQLVWHGSKQNPIQTGNSTGYDELDEHLDGGFQKKVTEIQSIAGIGELRLLLPILKNAVAQERLIVFIAPFGIISPQALTNQGFELDKIIIIYPDKIQDNLWAAEECLRSGACHSVIMWVEHPLEVHHIKRLNMASETGNCHQFIIRTQKVESLSLPLELSLSLKPHTQGLSARINKRKQGWPSNNFTIDMSKHWPTLTLKSAHPSSNLIHFPKARLG